jgi:hypothetical protein
MGQDYFIWIRRNPLKSPDSAKEIQGNPSFFPWIYLHFLSLVHPGLGSLSGSTEKTGGVRILSVRFAV